MALIYFKKCYRNGNLNNHILKVSNNGAFKKKKSNIYKKNLKCHELWINMVQLIFVKKKQNTNNWFETKKTKHPKHSSRPISSVQN